MMRWVFSDPVTLETWTFPQNPREMSSPTLAERTITAASGSGVIRSLRPGALPTTMTFGGSVRYKTDYDTMLSWKDRDLIHITDHRGRVFRVIPISFEPTPRRLTGLPWAFTYRFTGLYLGRAT